MKKLLSILTVFALILTAISFAPIAEAEGLLDMKTEGFWTYEVVKRTAVIEYYEAEINGKIEIPETLGGYTVTGIGGTVFADAVGLTYTFVRLQNKHYTGFGCVYLGLCVLRMYGA